MTDQDFKEMVWSKSQHEQVKYPLWFQKEFVEYWLTVPDTQTKNRFNLLSKKRRDQWSTLGTMATCIRTFYRTDPRWQEQKQMKHPDYYNKAHAAMINGDQYQVYKKHLEGLSFTFGGGSGGNWVKPPNKEIIWI